jgi:CRP/FNR family transcriptional regulator, cyclic AMP receptor protein
VAQVGLADLTDALHCSREGTEMARPPDVEILRRSVVLRSLPSEELAQLAAMMSRHAYRRGEAIFHQGDPGVALHLISDGHVKVVLWGETGDEVILTVLGPGELVGEMALLDGEPRSATVVALEPVQTAALLRADFLAFLRRSPAAVEGLVAGLARTIRRLSAEVGDLATLDLHGRLAKKLLELAEAHGRPADGAIEIQVPLTQEELAGMIGSTRPRVNRLLGFYEDRGAIARRARRIVILEPDVLRRWASL